MQVHSSTQLGPRPRGVRLKHFLASDGCAGGAPGNPEEEELLVDAPAPVARMASAGTLVPVGALEREFPPSLVVVFIWAFGEGARHFERGPGCVSTETPVFIGVPAA